MITNIYIYIIKVKVSTLFVILRNVQSRKPYQQLNNLTFLKYLYQMILLHYLFHFDFEG
jgi:hypothetical protein